jgi:hypothetical protein
MNSILNTSEIVGTVGFPEGEFEVCASADANYQHSSNTLTTQLTCDLRPCVANQKLPETYVDWMPKSQTVTEHVSIDEAGEVARDVFARWVRKIREVAPSLRARSF